MTLSTRIRELAQERPKGIAYIEGDEELTWSQYDALATTLATTLAVAGLEAGDRVGVLLPDGPLVHVVYLAAERAGLVVVGIGPRAGQREIEHLLRLTKARGLITAVVHRGESMADVVARLRRSSGSITKHLTVERSGADQLSVAVNGRPVSPPQSPEGIAGRAIAPDDLFLLNSTSGTTGMPKCVMQHQARWWHFHQVARASGQLVADDRIMSLIPAPFGFGLWTAHFTPAYLGSPTVLMARFDAGEAIKAIERHRVTVLCCVSTQFIMLLNHPEFGAHDLTSLRVMFTGGEAVPFERAAEFEHATGGKVLQFYGSNETGALSCTTLEDDREHRLRTAGRVIPEMNVRLFGEDGRDVTVTGERGQPGCKGPIMGHGYYEDEAANAALFTEDGWMLTGDIVEVDADGYLSVVGRASDFIIRGGKNISAVYVENEVGSHPAVALVAVVGMPDPVFGERVCAYVTLQPGSSLDLDSLVRHLLDRGVSKETLPERLEIVEEMTTASGGKVAKGELRRDIARRLERERSAAC